LISSNCFAGIMFDVQNFVSFTNSRLANKNYIDYVLLVQFSRFICSSHLSDFLYFNMLLTLCQPLMLVFLMLLFIS